MGDTENGSWGSRELLGHIRQMEAQAVKHKYLVVSYDPDEQQWFYDTVLATSASSASEFICALRPYVLAADASAGEDFGPNISLTVANTEYDASEPLSQCQNCEGLFPQSKLAAIKDLHQRVKPGEPMPSGECPECGALCQELEAAK